MIDDENDPEYAAVVTALFQQATILANMHGFTARTMELIDQLCVSAKKQAYQRGILLPDMVVAYFSSEKYDIRAIEIYDRNVDHKRLQAYIVTLIRKYPRLLPQEIMAGFRRAFPHYNPAREEMEEKRRRILEKRAAREEMKGRLN